MTQCTNCGATLEYGVTVCPACGTAQPGTATGGEAPVPAAAPAYAAPSAGPGSNLLNFARGAKGIALLCFVLPFVTVSCAGLPPVPMTGLDLATGSVSVPTMPGAGAGPATSYGVDIFVLIAALLIIAGLVATFVLPRRKAALAAMGACAVAAVLLVYDVFIRIPGAVEDQMERIGSTGSTPTAGAEYQQQLEQMTQAISVDPAIGFWLTLIALIAAIVLNKMVHGGRET